MDKNGRHPLPSFGRPRYQPSSPSGLRNETSISSLGSSTNQSASATGTRRPRTLLSTEDETMMNNVCLKLKPLLEFGFQSIGILMKVGEEQLETDQGGRTAQNRRILAACQAFSQTHDDITKIKMSSDPETRQVIDWMQSNADTDALHAPESREWQALDFMDPVPELLKRYDTKSTKLLSTWMDRRGIEGSGWSALDLQEAVTRAEGATSGVNEESTGRSAGTVLKWKPPYQGPQK